MTSRAIIPRFLLPLQGPLWRNVRLPLSHSVRVQFASSTPSKSIVLEKPAKFNPPSHGSRLKRNTTPKHYGPELSYQEVAEQDRRTYPGVMAPDGSWSYFFWHSKTLHTIITMGTLFALAVATFFMNYAYNSPFKDLVPPISDLWTSPRYFFVAWKNVISLHEQQNAMKAREHRVAKLDDVAKRRYFMKMHGIEPKDPVTMIFGKDEGQTEEVLEAVALGRELPPSADDVQLPARKKWFGLF